MKLHIAINSSIVNTTGCGCKIRNILVNKLGIF